MAHVMTKNGTESNVNTYEYICDTTADLANIDSRYITLGSTAIVLEGDAGLEVYMANSSKQWISLMSNIDEEETEPQNEP